MEQALLSPKSALGSLSGASDSTKKLIHQGTTFHRIFKFTLPWGKGRTGRNSLQYLLLPYQPLV
jgi:hypothetical protein